MNSLRPGDAVWRWRSWPTPVQVITCDLTAPSHYQNQCWLIIKWILWYFSGSSFMGIVQNNKFEKMSMNIWNHFPNWSHNSQGANNSMNPLRPPDAICVGKFTMISSDNGLPPGRRQATIIYINLNQCWNFGGGGGGGGTPILWLVGRLRMVVWPHFLQGLKGDGGGG